MHQAIDCNPPLAAHTWRQMDSVCWSPWKRGRALVGCLLDWPPVPQASPNPCVHNTRFTPVKCYSCIRFPPSHVICCVGTMRGAGRNTWPDGFAPPAITLPKSTQRLEKAVICPLLPNCLQGKQRHRPLQVHHSALFTCLCHVYTTRWVFLRGRCAQAILHNHTMITPGQPVQHWTNHVMRMVG